MKFDIFDKVKIVHTQEVGEVIEILKDRHYLVALSPRISIPVFEENLQWTHQQDLIKNQPQTLIQPVQKAAPPTAPPEDLLLSFIPIFNDDPNNQPIHSFQLYVVNPFNHHVSIDLVEKNKNDIFFTLSLLLNPQQTTLINTISFNHLSQHFKIECYWRDEHNKQQSFIYKMKPQTLALYIDELMSGQTPSFFIPIKPPTPVRSINLDGLAVKPIKSVSLHPQKTAIKTEKAEYVVDVHIEKIEPHYHQLSNYEIMQIQLKKVEKMVYLAYQDYFHSMIIIHGIGTGKLKNEIHQYLKTLNFVKKINNDYHPKFGFGATEVFFDY